MELNRKRIWLNIIFSSLLVIAGILIVVFAFVNPNSVDYTLSIIFAVALFLMGIVYLIFAIADQKGEFVTTSLFAGAAVIALGVTLLVRDNLISDFLIIFMGAFLIALAAVMLFKFIFAFVRKEKAVRIVGYGILFALGLTFGTLLLVYNGAARTTVFAIMGIIVIVASAAQLAFSIKLLSDSKHNK